MPKMTQVQEIQASFGPGTILSAEKKAPVSFETLIEQLDRSRIIFVGEKHNDPAHHAIQLKIIQAMFEKHPTLQIGMEMFDTSYQQVLTDWSSGLLDENSFLQRTHWYANWKFPYPLYKEILEFAKSNHIPVVALNIPFHIPAKISIGGTTSLQPDDSKYLPKSLTMDNAEHRSYVKAVFQSHHIPGRDEFEYFYQAQCVWEDVMAESIVENLGDDPMVVLVGNGHIINKIGIPDRVDSRLDAPITTIYLVASGTEISFSYADFIWISPPREKKKGPYPMHGKR
jgi:uncharacterized iron-regulated protein